MYNNLFESLGFDAISLFSEASIDIENMSVGRREDWDAIRKSGELVSQFVEKYIEIEPQAIDNIPWHYVDLRIVFEAMNKTDAKLLLTDVSDLRNLDHYERFLNMVLDIAICLGNGIPTHQEMNFCLNMSRALMSERSEERNRRRSLRA